MARERLDLLPSVLPHSAPLTLLPLHERWRDLRLLCRLGGTRRLGGCAITPEERTFANIRTRMQVSL